MKTEKKLNNILNDIYAGGMEYDEGLMDKIDKVFARINAIYLSDKFRYKGQRLKLDENLDNNILKENLTSFSDLCDSIINKFLYKNFSAV